MAKLWIFSDLHLETLPYPGNFRPDPPAFDVLVAAGDVWQADPGRAFAVLRRLAGDKPIVFVMGNHEHWNGIVTEDLILAKALADRSGIIHIHSNLLRSLSDRSSTPTLGAGTKPLRRPVALFSGPWSTPNSSKHLKGLQRPPQRD